MAKTTRVTCSYRPSSLPELFPGLENPEPGRDRREEEGWAIDVSTCVDADGDIAVHLSRRGGEITLDMSVEAARKVGLALTRLADAIDAMNAVSNDEDEDLDT